MTAAHPNLRIENERLRRTLGAVCKTAGVLIEAAASNMASKDQNDTWAAMVYRARDEIEAARNILAKNKE